MNATFEIPTYCFKHFEAFNIPTDDLSELRDTLRRVHRSYASMVSQHLHEEAITIEQFLPGYVTVLHACVHHTNEDIQNVLIDSLVETCPQMGRLYSVLFAESTKAQ